MNPRLVIAALLLLWASALAGLPHVRGEVRLAELYGDAAGLDAGVPDQVLLVVPKERRGPLESLVERLRLRPDVARVFTPDLGDEILASVTEREARRITRLLRGGRAAWFPAVVELKAGVSSRDLADEVAAEDVMAVGAPMIERALSQASLREPLRIMPPIAGVFFVVLWALFRRPGAALLPLVALAANALCIVGIVGWAGASLAGPNAMLLPLVCVLGLADSVHLVRRVSVLSSGPDAVLRALRHVGPPCLLTSATTAASFLVLATTSQPLYRSFGLLAAGGMSVAWLNSLAVPALGLWLWPSLVPVPVRSPARPVAPLRWGAAVWLAVVLATGAVGSTLPTALRPLASLPEPHAVRDAEALVDRELGGAHPLVLELHAPDGVEDPRAFDDLIRVRRHLAADPVVGSVISFADVAQWVGRGLDKSPDRLAGSPGASPATRRRLFRPVWTRTEALSRSLSPRPLVDPARDAYIVHARLVGSDVAQWADAIEGIEGLELRHLETEVRGHVAVAVAAWRQIRSDLLRALGAAGLATGLGVLLRFRSVGVTAITVLGLAAAVTVPLASMVLLGIPLDPPGVVVFALGIGVGVDGILHIASHLEHTPAEQRGLALVEAERPVRWSQGLLLVGLATLALTTSLPVLRDVAVCLAISTTAGVGATLLLGRALWLPTR